MTPEYRHTKRLVFPQNFGGEEGGGALSMSINNAKLLSVKALTHYRTSCKDMLPIEPVMKLKGRWK